MKYWDDGSKVYNGHDSNCFCWYLPPYYIGVDCEASWFPYGPSLVWVRTHGDYRPLLAHAHDATAIFFGYPNGEWSYYHYVSSLPFGYSITYEHGMEEL